MLGIGGSTATDITYKLKAGGKEVANTVGVSSIKVEQRANCIGTAQIGVLDCCVADATKSSSLDDVFKPGKSIEILAGYTSDSQLKTIYKGMVRNLSRKADKSQGTSLTVECTDTAVKMCPSKINKVYSEKTDKQIMTAVIGNTSGLTSTVASTSATYEQIVQYYSSDWDFLIARADLNGFVVLVDDAAVTVANVKDAKSSKFVATLGQNIISLDVNVDSSGQYSSVEATSWDPKTQKVITETIKNTETGPGDISSKDLAKAIGSPTLELQSPTSMTKEELKEWGSGILTRAAASKICGRVTVQGTAEVSLGKSIELKKVSDTYNGKYYVSGITHDLESGTWTTVFEVGVSPDLASNGAEFAPSLDTVESPGVSGLIQGTVMKITKDPDNAFRVFVNAPILGDSKAGVWARMTHPYATNKGGYFFMPEKDDEVVLGFFNDDPHFPVILGSMYSSDKIKPFSGGDGNLKPDLTPNDENSTKAIVTKSGLRISFQDTKKIITVTTPGKNYMIFDDDAGSITIQDQNKNKMVMKDSGISLESPKDIKIKANQKVAITGTQGVTIESSQKIESTAPTIKKTADAQFSVSTGIGEVKASGILTLKGSMVMIN